ncbi:carbohydrate ABC transporter permease [Sciscionella marina]|uniref:carbohydrate ABC transporter permease n=1 Tax=Sciscionella marina TaxID=508770 RepID=UPI00037943F0|nr:sugar ABC transporter permease [Sciscionella marina]
MAGRVGGYRMVWFVAPAVLFLAALVIYPLGVLLQMSFSTITPSSILGGWSWAGLDNYRPVLESAKFWSSLLATGYFIVLLLVVNLILGFVVACLLAVPARSGAILQGLMIFVWAMPPVVIGNVWKFLFAEDGLVNRVIGLVGLSPVGWLSDTSLAVWSVSAVTAWASLPFSVIMMKSAMLGIPQEVYDAAAVDGCGYWQTRWRVVLPLLRPTMLILAIFTVMYGFRSFDFVYVLTQGGPGTASATLPFYAYREAFTRFDFSSGSVVATLSLVIVFMLGFAYVRAARRELEG